MQPDLLGNEPMTIGFYFDLIYVSKFFQLSFNFECLWLTGYDVCFEIMTMVNNNVYEIKVRNC